MRTVILIAASLAVSVPQPVSAQQPAGAAHPRTRLMDDINWMEFAEWVPARVRTVIVTVGTLEPHGVVNNGADNTAPVAIARDIATDAAINAFIAPHIPYGVTGSMAPYPGALHIPGDVFRAYMRALLDGMAKNRFRDISDRRSAGRPALSAAALRMAGSLSPGPSMHC